jgi:hypothetical protein
VYVWLATKFSGIDSNVSIKAKYRLSLIIMITNVRTQSLSYLSRLQGWWLSIKDINRLDAIIDHAERPIEHTH